MSNQRLKLRIDLVPKNCWHKSLRVQMPRSRWDKLRSEVFAAQGRVCAVCGAGGCLNCHELWLYDDVRHVQKLSGFGAVCSMCHHVTHFGHATVLAAEGRIDIDAVVCHFMKVNGTSREEFQAHKAEAMRVWRERSKHEWTTDLGQWATLVSTR